MGHIKLTDFGLSKIGLMNLATNLYEDILDRDMKQFNDKQVYGTPEYIAPEVILRQGYGKPVDWWSMGIILYQFLVGCVAFFGETPEELFAHVINDEIEWPDEEDWSLPPEAKDLISQLLQQNQIDRLGTGGAQEVKEHAFFNLICWEDLLRQKAEFIPVLDDEDDTSYFDTREERYNHELEDSNEDLGDTDDSSMFSSFSSCSLRYHKAHSRIEEELAQEKLLKSSSTSSIAERHLTRTELSQYDPMLRTQSLNDDTSPPIEFKCNRKAPLSSSPLAMEHRPIQRKPVPPPLAISSTPDSSQTESDDFSPMIQRKRKPLKICLPKLSVSSIDMPEEQIVPPTEMDANAKVSPRRLGKLSLNATTCISIPNMSTVPKMRSITKSASASGISLMVPSESDVKTQFKRLNTQFGSPGGSSTSSRDTSPNRDSLSLQLKPPIIIRKGARGFGFTMKAIRVYYGDSDVYTLHHLVMAVEANSPAFEAGLRPGDLITHVNGESIQGMIHHQVLQLVLSGGDKINIRTTPLENTTIKSGGRKRNPKTSKMARRPAKPRKPPPPVKRSESDRRRPSKSSLLRRVSSKRASAELQQLLSAGSGSPLTPPATLTPSRSHHSLSRLAEGAPNTPTRTVFPRSPPTAGRLHQHHHHHHSLTSDSSQSSSPTSSLPNSPSNLSATGHFQRPSTLHGLKHKLVQTFRSPRRKSCGHIPLSPLARTPSPSILPLAASSPNRSPSPLTFAPGHQLQIQKSLSASGPEVAAASRVGCRGSEGRPKSAEPGSSVFGAFRSLEGKEKKSKLGARCKKDSPSPLVTSSLPPCTSKLVTCTKGQRSIFSKSHSGSRLETLEDKEDREEKECESSTSSTSSSCSSHCSVLNVQPTTKTSSTSSPSGVRKGLFKQSGGQEKKGKKKSN